MTTPVDTGTNVGKRTVLADESDVMGALVRRRLIALRHNAGVSQRKLAQLLNWSSTRVASVETGRSPLTVEDATRYAGVLNHDVLITFQPQTPTDSERDRDDA